MGPWTWTFALASPVLAVGVAHASPCEVAVEVTGDPDLVATVRGLVTPQTIEVPGDRCPVVRARLERRGQAIAVVRLAEVAEERLVLAPATAAAVLESWSRADLVFAPLAVDSTLRAAAPAPAPLAAAVTSVTPVAAPVRSGGVQVFASMETTFADDETSWLGGVVGVCVPLGRVCATARARFATVTDGSEMWEQAERHSQDVLVGGDVPVRVGRTRLAVGFGAGIGAVHTRSWANDVHAGSETFGLRGDVHLAWMVPVSTRFAIDLSASIDLAEVVDVESHDGLMTDEPQVLARLGAGLRFGGR